MAGPAGRVGLLRPSFVPPPEIRALRDSTRARTAAAQGPDAGMAAAGEAARGRHDEALIGGLLRWKEQDGLGDGGGDRRRRARPARSSPARSRGNIKGGSAVIEQALEGMLWGTPIRW